MRISIFGLGYVGAVTSACMVRDGHHVIGVDLNAEKVSMMENGLAPIVEPGLEELLRDGLAMGRLTATTDGEAAVQATDLSMISVGTPPDRIGRPDLSHVEKVCEQIGTGIRKKTGSHVVVLRSTVPPGTTQRCNLIVNQHAEIAVPMAFNPEFLREGSAVRDFDEPPYTVIGTQDAVAERAVRELYSSVAAPVHVVSPESAELVKTVSNAWHATKVSFANEIGRLARAWDIDGRSVLDLFARDQKLNISAAYLRPGFAFGGSCLPKDTRALVSYARDMAVKVPLLESVEASNDSHIVAAVECVTRLGAKSVGLFGLAFKAGTDDLRESPAIPLVKGLLGEGISVKIFDRAVRDAKLVGTNLAYIRANLPHFEELLVDDPEDAAMGVELVVVTHSGPDFRQWFLSRPHGGRMLDLAGIFAAPPPGWEYHGISW